jgi:hypothetical protein
MPEILEVSQMIPPAYEPKRQNRWILEWDGIDAYAIRSFARPSLQFDEIVVDFVNTKRYYQGKFSWSTVDLVLNDPIAPSQAQKVMEWVRLGFENLTGRAGFKEFYTAKNFKLKMLDPAGSVVELWDFIGCMVMNANFNSLDYTSAEIAQVNVTLRFDMAILSY